MPQIPNILVLCPVAAHHRDRLGEALPNANLIYTTPEAASNEQIAQADAIFGRPDPQQLRLATRLRFLQLQSAGTEPYLNPGVLPEGAQLANATGSYGLGIAEYMMGTLLTLCKKLHRYRDQQHEARWEPLGEVRAVFGSTVLVVGLGDIGSEFARRVKMMGATVIGVRRRGTDRPDYVDELYLTEQLDSLLPRADVVALCLPNTAQTRNLFDRERIGRMKPGAMLLNVGRGTAVDAEALCDALDQGRLWGAAVDVTDPEPLPATSRMWHTENLLLTPHVSGGFSLPETHDRIIETALKNLQAFVLGGPIINEVDFETGYRKLPL